MTGTWARPSRLALLATLIFHFGLMAALLSWCGWLFGAILCLPLLAPLPGLLRGRTYTAAWASLLLIFYIAGVLSEGLSVRSRHTVGLGLSIWASLEFVSLLMFVRWSARERTTDSARTAGLTDAPR